jgi:glycosyltransferase involved in cell wall biosynthesis
VLFVAGLDWEAVPDPAPAPVINLIQGVRHGDAGDPRRGFLSRPAIRICVSDEVAAAIVSTGLVNGPVHVIPNGIDLGDLPPTTLPRDIPVLIAGMKNPAFARTVEDRLRRAGIEAECLVEPLPRAAFLERLARAAVAITIPVEREGFFLPALEAMAVGAVVVCPDCVGNRGFCRDRETAFRPAYTLDDVVAAAIEAVRRPPQAAEAMRAAAAREVRHHGLEAERLAFLRILDAV